MASGQIDEVALVEYQTLREEIARHDSEIFDMFKFAITGAVAIIAFGIQQYAQDNSYAWAIVGTVPLIVVPAGLFSLSRVQMEMRIGAYLSVFFEEKSLDLNWERALATRCRGTAKHKGDDGPDRWLKVALFSGYVLVGLTGLAVAWILADSPLGTRVMWGETAGAVLLAVFALSAVLRYERSGLEDSDTQVFREIRDGDWVCRGEPCATEQRTVTPRADAVGDSID